VCLGKQRAERKDRHFFIEPHAEVWDFFPYFNDHSFPYGGVAGMENKSDGLFVYNSIRTLVLCFLSARRPPKQGQRVHVRERRAERTSRPRMFVCFSACVCISIRGGEGAAEGRPGALVLER